MKDYKITCSKERDFLESLVRRRIATSRYKEKKKLDSGNTVYVYGPRQIQNRNKEKAKRLDGLQDRITGLRKKLKSEVKNNPVSLVISLMDETAERVGNPASAKDGHFGVTGWRKNHLKFSGGSATISYIGKSGVKQEKKITNKGLVSALKQISKGLKENEELFAEVSSEDVNEYLKPFKISAKDIRGYHANDTMRCVLERNRKKGPKLPNSRKEKDKILKEEFKKALEETAEMVGHEASTLRSQYLVPGMEDKYLHNGEIMSRMKKASSVPSKYGETRWKDIIWYMDISKDSFIHFSYESRIQEILKSGKLLMNPPYPKFGIDAISAISTSWGQLTPGVQTTHLRRGKNKEPIAAILFKTKTKPEYGRIEEVVWGRDVVFTNAKRIPFTKALQILKSNFKKVGDQDIVVYDKKEANQYLDKTATLSQTEREDRASKVKAAPKKKPPRYDLRRNRSTEDEKDPTIEDIGRGDGGDRDLSKKWNKIGFSLLVAKMFLAEEKPGHNPGEVWKTKDGKWRGMNPEGLSDTFEGKDEAQSYADGKDSSKVEDPQEEEPKKEEDPKEELPTAEDEPQEEDSKNSVSDSEISTAKSIISQILGDDTVFENNVQKSLKDAFKGLDEQQRKEFSKSLKRNLKDLSGQDSSSKAMINMANKAVSFDGYEELTDPTDLGKKLAEAVFARNVVANPLILGGEKLSSKELGGKEVSDRAIKAYNHFSSLSQDLQKHAADTLNDYLENLDEEAPQQNEANGILSALALNSIVQTGQSVSGRPEPSKGTAELVKNLAEQGNISMLLQPVEDYFEPKNQESLKAAMKRMSTEELFDLVMKDEDGGKEPHPFAGLKELFDQEIPIPYPYNEGIKDFIINDYLSDHVWKDAVIRDTLKHSGKDEDSNTAEERYKILQEVKREAQSQLFEKWKECLKGAQEAAAKGNAPSSATEDCLKDFEDNKKKLFEAESANQFLSALSERGLEIPNSPAVAALRTIAETGDTSILGQRIKPNPDSFSGKRASRYLFDRSKVIHTRTNFFREPQFTRRQKMISKQAAQKITAYCDVLAEFFQKNAEDMGITQDVGIDMAKRLDTMSVFLEDSVGIKSANNPTDVIDPSKNYTEENLEGWEFDPADIGEEDSGALLRDKDEPYMDTFNQDEFDQLRKVQQGGMFSNAKAASAMALKMYNTMVMSGLALPVPKKKTSV